MMSPSTPTFRLDPRLERDTLAIDADDRWQTLLMNDRRWPWIIVVPSMPDLADIDDLPDDALILLTAYLGRVSRALKLMGVCTSTNVATLGNVVTQMHWHVVGRNAGDANWPGPVWGYQSAVPYAKEEADAFIDRFRKSLRADPH